jgi:large subunit ribosomal protein L10
MSKKVKSLIEKDLASRFSPLEGIAVVNPRGIGAIKNNAMRRRLREKGLRMAVVKNTLARRASDNTKIKGFDTLLDGPSAVIYGQGSVSAIARILLDEKKADETLELRGIFFDGEVYTGQEGVEQASKLPTREEAIGQVVALILAPGAKLGGIFKGQAGKVAALIKAVEERAEKAGGGGATEAAPATEAASA